MGELADVVDRANLAFLGAWTVLAGEMTSGVLAAHDGVAIAATGLPDPTLNPAFVVREPDDAAGTLAWAADLRRTRGAVSTGVDVPEGRFPRLEASFADSGYVRHVGRPGMVLATDALTAPPTPTDLDLRPVRTRADWTAYTDVQAEVFGFDPQVASEFPPYDVVGHLRMQLLVGALDGQVTCAAAVFVTGRDAGVFAVGTRAEHRGRGHGTAVTAEAVRVAARMGAELAVLQSTEVGLGVYRTLGFREICPWAVWVNPSVEP